ncbi:MAG: transposase [Anaerolineae bacterium]|nr:transposase [Anaerolineae bacterium]
MTDFLQDHPDGVVLALDEMSLYFQATLTRVWAPVGQTPIVAVHPQRDHVHFYGALNLCTGREIALPAPEATSALTANFLMQVLMLYPQPIFLLLDRAPWHYGEVSTLIAETDRLHVMHFPCLSRLEPSRTCVGASTGRHQPQPHLPSVSALD